MREAEIQICLTRSEITPTTVFVPRFAGSVKVVIQNVRAISLVVGDYKSLCNEKKYRKESDVIFKCMQSQPNGSQAICKPASVRAAMLDSNF